MDKIAHQALLDSITVWEGKLSPSSPYDVQLGSHVCPLCDVYNLDIDRDLKCAGCPIREFTREQFCNGSPYAAAVRALYILRAYDNSSNPNENGYAYAEALEEWNRCARDMIDFMKNLLPKETNSGGTV